MDFVGVKNQVCNKKFQISGILKKSAIDISAASRKQVCVTKTPFHPTFI